MMKRRGAPLNLPTALAQETESARDQLVTAGVGGYGMPIGDAPLASVERPLTWSGSEGGGSQEYGSPKEPRQFIVDDETRRATAAFVLDLTQQFVEAGHLHPTVVDALRAGFASARYPDVPVSATDSRVASDSVLSDVAVPREVRLNQAAARQHTLLDVLIQHARNVAQAARAVSGEELRTSSSRGFVTGPNGVEINGFALNPGSFSSPSGLQPAISDVSSPLGAAGSPLGGITSPPNFEVASLDDLDIAGGKVIGRGAGGRVVSAVHKGTGQRYAVKEILMGTTEAHRQISSEISVLWGTKRGAHLRPSPFVVGMKGCFFNDGIIYVAMELMDGSLKDVLNTVGGAIAEVDVRCLTYQILLGLSFLHDDLRRLHRDIKPHNILFRAATGEVKVSDFGLASEQLSTRVTGRGTFCGTIAYMSPERALGERYGYETDLWSVGMTVYHLGVGDLPIPERTLNEFAVGGWKNARPSLPETIQVSDAMRDFIRLCFAPPSEGVSVKQLLAHPWMQGLTPELCQGHLLTLFHMVTRAKDAASAQSKAPISGIGASKLLASLDNAF